MAKILYLRTRSCCTNLRPPPPMAEKKVKNKTPHPISHRTYLIMPIRGHLDLISGRGVLPATLLGRRGEGVRGRGRRMRGRRRRERLRAGQVLGRHGRRRTLLRLRTRVTIGFHLAAKFTILFTGLYYVFGLNSGKRSICNRWDIKTP